MDELYITIILGLVVLTKIGAPVVAIAVVVFVLPGAVKKGVMRGIHASRQTAGQAYSKTSWGRQRDMRRKMKEAFQGRDAANKVNEKLTRGGGLLGWRSARASLRQAQIAGFSPTKSGQAARGRVADYSNQQNIKTISEEIGQENPEMVAGYLAGRGDANLAVNAVNNMRAARGQQRLNADEERGLRSRVEDYNRRGYQSQAGAIAMMRHAGATASLTDDVVRGAAHLAGVDHPAQSQADRVAGRNFANEVYQSARAARSAGWYAQNGNWDSEAGRIADGGTTDTQVVERLNADNFGGLDQGAIPGVVASYSNLHEALATSPQLGNHRANAVNDLNRRAAEATASGNTALATELTTSAATLTATPTATSYEDSVNFTTPEGIERTIQLETFLPTSNEGHHLNELARAVAKVRDGKTPMEARKVARLNEQVDQLRTHNPNLYQILNTQVRQRQYEKYYD